MHDAFSEIDDLQVALSQVETRLRHAVSIDIAGERIYFATDAEYGTKIAHSVFEPLCDVRSLKRNEGTDGSGCSAWRIFSVGVDGFSDLISRLSSIQGRRVQRVRRWKGDHDAVRIDFPSHHAVVIHREPFRGLTVFAPSRRTIYYLRPDGECDVPHTEHTIKYPLRVMLRRRGSTHVHAASCCYRGLGMLIMGFRKSGKTTLLMHLLSRGAYFIASDLSFVQPSHRDDLTLLAFPHMTRIAPGTIEDNVLLSQAFRRERKRSRDYLESAVLNDGKVEMYYPVVRRIFSRDIARRRSRLDLVVFPSLDLSRNRTEVRLLAPERARSLVRERLIDDPPLPEWLPFFPHEEILEFTRRHAETVVERLPPVYEVLFGNASTDPVAVLDEIVAPWPETLRNC